VDWEIEILVDGDGPLVDEFRAVGRTRVLRNTDRLLGLFPLRWRKLLQPHVNRLCVRALFAGRQFDLIYANTVATWPHVDALRKKAPSLVWHIHELRYAFRLHSSDVGPCELLRNSTAVVAVSKSVRDMLTREHEVSVEKVDLIHGFVRPPELTPDERIAKRERVKREFGWPSNAFVIGACGALGWRKGTDLFLQIAKRIVLTKEYDRICFLWVGGGIRDKEVLEFEHDLHVLGLKHRCVRVPAASDVLDYYCAMDVFALTSREDPFPLVMLEAAVHAIPVVCFDGSGGGPEFVGPDAGLIAPYLDVPAFADHVSRLYEEPDLRQRLGGSAAQKVRTCYSFAIQAPKLLDVIRRSLPPRTRASSCGQVPRDVFSESEARDLSVLR
jgi:glycosyltransferase involved in cell wall biosynthesis